MDDIERGRGEKGKTLYQEARSPYVHDSDGRSGMYREEI